MPDSDAADHLQLECVRLSSDGAAEMDQHRAVISVPRSEITQLEVAYGSGAENPVVLIALGFVFLAIALAPLVVLALMVIRNEGTMDIKVLTAVAFVIPAWWLLDLALRKRWYVRVHMRSGTRKLVFHRERDRTAILTFVADASRRFGYTWFERGVATTETPSTPHRSYER